MKSMIFRMGRQKSFDPDEKLDEAMRLFWQKGYHNTKLDTIISELKLGKRSFYDTFGSKEELFMRSLDRYFEMGGGIHVLLQDPEASLKEILQIFDFMLNVTVGDPLAKSCMMSNSILELANINAEVKMKASIYLDNITKGFENALHNAIKNGEVRPVDNVRTLAILLNTMMSGTSIMSRGGYTPKEIKKSVDLLFTTLRM